MEIQQQGNDILVSRLSCFDLALTLECGQAFRWEKQPDGAYCGVAGQYFLCLRQTEQGLLFQNTDEKAFAFWRQYFDLDTDYAAICAQLCADRFCAQAIGEYAGIRILQQDSWEALCSFIISQQNNIPRIKQIIRRLCAAYGEPLGNGYFTFPEAARLAALEAEDLQGIGAGYRAKYLVRLARKVAAGQLDLAQIKTLPLEDARKALLGIYGVGNKVADCALLFGFRFFEAFPVDVWMKRVMTYYPDGLPACFAGYEGIAQQYLFHWIRHNSKQ